MPDEDDDPVNDRDNFKSGIFYFNPDDDRLLIRLPGTVNRYVFNYARWQIYLVALPVAAMICHAFFYRR